MSTNTLVTGVYDLTEDVLGAFTQKVPICNRKMA